MNALGREVAADLKTSGEVERTVMATWSIIVGVTENAEELAGAICGELHNIGINADVEVGEAE